MLGPCRLMVIGKRGSDKLEFLSPRGVDVDGVC